MRARLRLSSLLFVLAIAVEAWPSAQLPPPPPPGGGGPPPPPPVVGTGFIAGQVVDYPSGRPLPDVTVRMLSRVVGPVGRAGAPQLPAVVTDAQGRFYFSRLPPGTYTPQVNEPRYVGALINVELADGEQVTGIKIRLRAFASISGTLRDEAGDPVVGTEVVAFRRTTVNGRPGLQGSGRIKSDDRGGYRLSGMQAGDYYVCACVRDPNPFDNQLLTTLASQPLQLLSVAARALTVGADVVSLDNTLRTYAPTFHPDSRTVARATRVTVAPGDEKTGVDINVELVRATRVSGMVVGAQSPISAFEMRLVPVQDAEAGVDLTQLTPMLVQPDGRFDFASVPPGQYRLLVAHRETDQRGGLPTGLAMGFVGARGTAPPSAAVAGLRGGGPPADSIPLWANEPVSVPEGGASGIVVNLNRGLNVTGRLAYVGGAPQPPAQQFNRITVILLPVIQPAVSTGSPVGRISPDASFAVQGLLPGKYRAEVPALPGFPTLKSVMLGGLDLTDLPIEIADKDLSELVITFVDTPLASLRVTTPVPAGDLNDDVVAVIFPTDRKYWTEIVAARRRLRSGPFSPKGVITFGELPAGDYFVVAGLAQELIDWADPARLDTLSRRAQRVTVTDGAKQTIEVRR